MASSSTQRPSSSSSTFVSRWRYDLFLSFRGEDTRTNFTDHLYSALIRNNINTFRDGEELPKGGEISPQLLQAIEESRIAVIVFSKTYADSKWCLEELVKIMSCKEEREQKVIPIFYHVDPSEVRNQKGIYEEAFAGHEENADDDQKKETIRRWKTAMREAGNLAGYHVKDRYESKIIDDIIEEIHGIIPKALYVNENIVGMDSRLERLISLLNIRLNDVRMIGVYGIGGIGKTTIITALYNKISNKFRSISFLKSVREESTNDSGLLKLQQQLLDDTLEVRGQLTIKNIFEGANVIKNRLSSKKVLVFLDDIDDSRQLEHLAGERCWFGHGSRIIITTRKKYLLTTDRVNDMYEVEKLNNEEALQLFCSYAFKNHLPRKGYGDLSHLVVRYADGLPLALKVLGSLLFGKELKDWIGELKKLEEVPNMNITKVLKISYDGLDDTQKRIFLDIACFFRGNDVQMVTEILDGSGFYAESGINALVDRCFITISKKEKIEMHDLLGQMGEEIVYKESPAEPGKRSRLWREMDVCQVLTRNTGTEKIEGIRLPNECTPEQIKFTPETFKRMNKLRVLDIFYKRVQLSEDFAFPYDDLTCLNWDGYSLASLPSNFRANRLVYLGLNNSNIKRLWERNLRLTNLRFMHLDGSQQLIEIPEFSTMPNLTYLSLSGCVSLESLPGDIHELKSLLSLHCDDCSKLTSFPELKRNIGKLEYLGLDGTAIKELPSSIELLKDLRHLHLKNCKNLESLPDSICKLGSLKTLVLNGCTKLGKLPEDLERMKNLETLYLKSVRCRLPSLSGLSQLRILCLDECSLTPGVLIKRDNRLNALEELSLRNCNLNEGVVLNQIFHLCSLKVLDLSGCNLEEAGGKFVGISQLSNLRALGLSHCKKLSQISELPSSIRLLDAHSSIGNSLPPMHSLANCLKSANQDLEQKRSLDDVLVSDSSHHGQGICIVVQGSSGIPEWIRNQKEGSRMSIELPKVWYENNDFLGVAICCVYVPLERCEDIPESDDSAHESEIENEFVESLNERKDSLDFACLLNFGDGYESSPKSTREFFFLNLCKSYHYGGASEQLWVTLYPKVAITEIYTSNPFTSLQADFLSVYGNCKVLKCGFQPIYAYDPTMDVSCFDYCQRDVENRKLISCFDCTRNVENRKLCLKGQPINQLPTETECAAAAATTVLDTLCLRDCKNLVSLPTSIWDDQFNSLKSLFCSNCSQLQCFPEVLRDMENLRELRLDGTGIKELPSSIEHLKRLEILDLRGCQELVTLPESICNLCFLQYLNVGYCYRLRKLPQSLGRLKSLKSLFAVGLNSRCCQSLSLSGLCSLKGLFLSKSMLRMRRRGAIISDIFCLYSLEILDLSHCKLDGGGGIPSEILRLSSLVELCLNANRFRSIPTWINQLSMLRSLYLSHCQKLEQIAELPSSLRVLDVHGCRLLETSSPLLSSSLFKCFQSIIQDLERGIDVPQAWTRLSVFISGSSGIPKWIRPWKKGSEVVAKLPQDWYKDGDLLGFVLYSIYDHPVLDNECEAGQDLDGANYFFKCDLNLLGHGRRQLVADPRIEFYCDCSDVMWMFYYPKVAIEKKYRSNKWKQLKASFSDCSHGKALMKADKCGIHLLYASHGHEQNPVGESMRPTITICRECQQDEQSGSQLMFCANGDDIDELSTIIEGSLQPDSLCLRGCINLTSLPSSISELKSLTALFCSGCSRLRSFPEILEDMENLKQLYLDGTAIEELPASIQHLNGLQFLNLDYCNSLVRLPESICNLKSLTTLSCSGCSNLRKFPEIRENMEILIKLDLGGSAIEALPSSIENLRGLQHLNMRRCNNLRSLPSSIGGLKSLTTLICSGCSQLRSFPEILEKMGNLKRLYLDRTAIEELPESIQHLQGLQYLDLTCCNNLVHLPESICYLKSVITLSCSSCSNLREFPEIWENMENLRDLDLHETSIKELSSSIENLQGLRHLNLRRCNNLRNLPSSICKLKSLTTLFCSDCSQLRSFPEILEDMENLKELHLDGTTIKELPASIQHLKGLEFLNLEYCKNLASLPKSICNLKSLTTLSCYGCSNLWEFPKIWDNMDILIKLDMGRSAIEALPSSIEILQGLQRLNLSRCNYLRSLPSSICELKSLTTLICSGCSQLRSFPEILEEMGNLERLYLDRTSIEDLPESIQHLQGLQYLDLKCCDNLVCLPKSICNLKSLVSLSCSGCSNLGAFPEISENMENLRDLDLSGTSIKELPSSIEHLRGLHYLYVQNCSNLVNIPESICKLSSLQRLYVDFCTELEKFPENLGSLQCLDSLGVSGLNLNMDSFSSIAADIIQLSKLRILHLSHCPKLVQVPNDLPPTLRVLDVHNCTCLETPSSSLSRLLDISLLKCFKSAIQELECGSYWNKAIRVLTPGNNGIIPEWIGQREKGSQIVVELPQDWHKNNDFLGFAVYSVCIPLGRGWFNCKLNFCGNGDGDGDGDGRRDVDNVKFSCCEVCVEPKEMCVVYYPKVAIEEQYWSNKWRRLKASYHGLQGLPVQVTECGFHLIYAQNIPEDTGNDAQRRWDNTQGTQHNDDRLTIEEYNDEQRRCDTRSSAAAEDASGANAQTSHDDHTQFTEHADPPPPTDTTTVQNVSDNVVDPQDDHIYNGFGLFRKFVRWIYYIFWRRY